MFKSLQKCLAAYKSFARHSNSEHEQALIRIGIGLLICIYIFFSELESGLSVGFVHGAIIFLSVSFLILVHIWRHPEPLPARKFTGIFNDTSAITYSLFFFGELSIPLYLIYFWVAFGNGFRFGKPYLYCSLVFSLIGFAIVMWNVDFWRNEHVVLGFWLWFGLIMVGLYFSTLVTRMTTALLQEERANQAKRRFISSVSHELRTPLNAIIGMANLLQSTRLNSEQTDLVRSLDNASHLMLALIEDVLDFSKIEAGKQVIENVEFDLHQLINSIVDVFKYQVRERGLHLQAQFHPDVPYALLGDPHHLRQVLVNLLANAVKFTEKGRIILRVEILSETENMAYLHFAVQDTGIGISEQAQGKVFDSFTQADDSTTRRYGGTGLGTTISKQLVELMGGRLGLHSTLGVGSTFWFELALERQPAPSEQATLSEQQKFAGLRTLLIGFDEEEASVIAHMLDGWGVPNQRAESLDAACAKLEEATESGTPYLLTLLDGWRVRIAKHPAKSAPSFFRHAVSELQNAARNANLAVILCGSSGSTHDGGRQFAEQSGLSALLDVPLEKRLLFNAMHAVNAGFASPSETIAAEVKSVNQHYAEPHSRRYTILVAEDNPTNQKVIKKILERAGHLCTLVANGEEALDQLDLQDFDAVVLDMNMPVMTGLEAAQAYRLMHSATGARAPVIMLSADVTMQAQEEALAAGVDEFLPKPIQVTRFLETLDRLVRKFGIAQQRLVLQRTPLAPPVLEPSTEDVVLDYATLAELDSIGQDTNFVDGLIAGFIDDNQRLVRELESSLLSQRYEEFKDILHAIGGSALSIGGLSLRSSCQRFEKMSHRELQCATGDVLHTIQYAFRQLCDALVHFHTQRERAMSRHS